MSSFPHKIEYFDLREEARQGRLPQLVGRDEEAERLTRVVGRRLANNVLVVGAAGTGRTAFVHGWVRKLVKQRKHEDLAFLEFSTEHLATFAEGNAELAEELARALPPAVLVIDDFGRALHNRHGLAANVFTLYRTILKEAQVRLVATLEPHEYEWLSREQPAFVQLFETVHLKRQTVPQYVRILQSALPRLNEERQIFVPSASLKEIVLTVERFPVLGPMPASGIGLLDECLASCASLDKRTLDQDTVAHVVASKTGIPKARLNRDDLQALGSLEEQLRMRVVGQEGAIRRIAETLKRAKLGLRNPSRPLGSFLMLGPSGVGKTETAKLIAETMFGRAESFVRFDMSEFQQDHTVQRLVGAPAGYIGYEEGGALTNALRREPYSLVLLDEIEKAHPKVFDVFLQVLDDGRLTSGQNETVDARNAIFMATSNAAVDEILKAQGDGEDLHSESFLKERVVPALARTFRLEFINRFDSILVFNPLSLPTLLKIAELEIRKTERRLARHKVRFEIDPDVLEASIRQRLDPRFGARPVKRFVEETCESLLAEALLAGRT